MYGVSEDHLDCIRMFRYMTTIYVEFGKTQFMFNVELTHPAALVFPHHGIYVSAVSILHSVRTVRNGTTNFTK